MFDIDDDDDDDDLRNADDRQQQQQGNADDDDDQQQQQQQQPPAIDHNAIAQTVAATMQQFQQPALQRQPTQEELAQHYQVWNPEPSFVNDMNKLVDADVPIEERMKLLHQMRDGMVNQAFRGAELLIEQKMQQMQAQMAPAIQVAQERQSKQLMRDFETSYPALKGQKDLVDSITARLGAQGFRPKSKDEAFGKVAEIAETILKGVNPQFTLKQSGGTNGMPSMAGTNMGGQTGGFQAQPRGTGAPKKRGGLASIFQNR